MKGLHTLHHNVAIHIQHQLSDYSHLRESLADFQKKLFFRQNFLKIWFWFAATVKYCWLNENSEDVFFTIVFSCCFSHQLINRFNIIPRSFQSLIKSSCVCQNLNKIYIILQEKALEWLLWDKVPMQSK